MCCQICNLFYWPLCRIFMCSIHHMDGMRLLHRRSRRQCIHGKIKNGILGFGSHSCYLRWLFGWRMYASRSHLYCNLLSRALQLSASTNYDGNAAVTRQSTHTTISVIMWLVLGTNSNDRSGATVVVRRCTIENTINMFAAMISRRRGYCFAPKHSVLYCIPDYCILLYFSAVWGVWC